MAIYRSPSKNIWKGRAAETPLYIYQKVLLKDLSAPMEAYHNQNAFALLGYQCDEGVRRNQGRVGAKDGPDAIRKELGKFADHFPAEVSLIDFGNIVCDDQDLTHAHESVTNTIKKLLDQQCRPVVLGGGHDLAFAHYCGIKKHLGDQKRIGIINLDAHFDLRPVEDQPNSGTPFNQIASLKEGFDYLCLGIQRQANTKELYRTAHDLGVAFIELDQFNLNHREEVPQTIQQFMERVDHIYLTVDLDGFSSAYAPGVSAASPVGFSPELVQKVIRVIVNSGKMISADVVELNPAYDRDNQTAKLGAWVVSEIIQLQC